MTNKMMKKICTLTLTLAVAFSFLGCSAATNAQKAPIETSDTESKTASEKIDSDVFSTMNTTDLQGNTVDSSIFSQDKLTFINSWNIGCTPCVQEIPVLDQLNKEYENKGVSILGLYHNLGMEVSDELKKEIEAILTDSNADYQQLLMSNEMSDSDIIKNMQSFPTTFIVNEKGEIIDKIEGSNDYEGWKATIESYLAQVEADA